MREIFINAIVKGIPERNLFHSEITSKTEETKMSEKTTVEETEKKESAFVLLKKKDFTALFIGGFISNMGTWFTQIAVIF